jgi:hypothetical protein
MIYDIKKNIIIFKMGASKKIMKAAVGGSTTKAEGGFSPVDMLAGKFPENTNQKPKFAGGMGGLIGVVGSAIPSAARALSGGKGKATFSGDSFSKKDEQGKKDSKKDQFRTFRVSKDLDYEATKKRLLELAKEEAIKINAAKEADKLVYDRSLPNQDKK